MRVLKFIKIVFSDIYKLLRPHIKAIYFTLAWIGTSCIAYPLLYMMCNDRAASLTGALMIPAALCVVGMMLFIIGAFGYIAYIETRDWLKWCWERSKE